MASTFNLNGMAGVVRVVRHALMGTFLLEGLGCGPAGLPASCPHLRLGAGAVVRNLPQRCPPSAMRASTCWGSTARRLHQPGGLSRTDPMVLGTIVAPHRHRRPGLFCLGGHAWSIGAGGGCPFTSRMVLAVTGGADRWAGLAVLSGGRVEQSGDPGWYAGGSRRCSMPSFSR